MAFNALVTGANGFVGAHLCKTLTDYKVNVFAMVRKTSNLSLFKSLNPELERIQIVYGDLTDYASLLENVQGKDVIFNIAGALKGNRQEDYDRINVDGTVNLCKAILENNPKLQRLLITSSIAAAGPGEDNKIACEEDPPRPLKGDRYGISKHRMECAIEPYKASLPIVIVRPPTVIGPGDEPSFDLFKTVKQGLKIVVGKQKSAFSIVSVGDLCEGFYRCAVTPAAVGQTFYFCSGDPIDWGDLQEIIAKEVFQRTKPLRKISIPKKMAIGLGATIEFFGKLAHKPLFLNKSKMIEGAATNWAFRCDKAKKVLEWTPKDGVASTVKKAGEWYLQNGWL